MGKNKILCIICVVLIIFMFSLFFLGNVSRKGYLSEFKFDDNNINKTLELNGIDINETKKLFVVSDKFDNDDLINYIFTNTTITNYHYSFRLKYYSKFFRNSDIYGVYIDTNKIIQDNNFIKEIRFDENGSPFGVLTSSKKLQYDEKINNINYKLKIKPNIIIILIVFCLFINMIFIISGENRKKLLIEYLNKTKSYIIKYKKQIFILYSIINIIFILFVIIISNIKYTLKLNNLELIAESRTGYVYRAKLKNYNKLFTINRNSIKVDNINYIKYYGYALEITNKPLGSWHSTNIYYTENNTFIISNESIEENAYYYDIQVPTFIGDKYKITIFLKQIPKEGIIKWHLNGKNNFKEINNKIIYDNYIVLTDTREVASIADGNLDLHLKIPQGTTEIESILIESLNSNLNVENEYTIFTSNKKVDTIKIQYNIKLNNVIKFLIIIMIILLLLLLFIIYKDYIKLFLYDEKFKKYKKYILLVYSFIVILFILFVIINSNIKRTSQLTDLELIMESRIGYVYKAKIKSDNKLFSIDRNSIKVNNANDIKCYGYSLEITNKPLGSWHSTNIYYTENNTFIMLNESTNVNAYYYNIQVPTYIGDKYKITILAKQLPKKGTISWHLNGNNNFKEITKKEVSNDYIVLTDTREVDFKAGGVLNLHLIISQGTTEIESILIESINDNLNIENNYTIFTSDKKIDNLSITYKLKNNYIILMALFISAVLALSILFNYIKIFYGLIILTVIFILNKLNIINYPVNNIFLNYMFLSFLYLTLFILVDIFEKNTDFFKNTINDINNYFFKDKYYIIIISVFTFITYGFKLFHFSKDIDDTHAISGSASRFLLSQSRPGSFIIRLLYDFDVFVPFWNEIIGIILLIIGTSLWGFYYYKIYSNNNKNVNYTLKIIFPILFISAPILVSLFIFSILRLSLTILLVSISLLILNEIFKKFNVLEYILVSIIVSLSVSIIESGINYFVIGAFSGLLLLSNNNKNIKIYIKNIIIILSICLIALIFKKIYSVILMNINDINRQFYTEGNFLWNLTDINDTLKKIKNLILPIHILLKYNLHISWIIILLSSIYLSIKNKNILIIITSIILLYSSISMNIITGGNPLYERAVIAISSFISFSYIFPLLIFYNYKFAKISYYIIIVFILLNNAKEVNGLYQIHYLRYERDKDLTLNIAHKIIDRTSKSDNKPIFFIGFFRGYSYDYYTYKINKDRFIGYSEYTWALSAKEGGYLRIANTFMIHGYPISLLSDNKLKYNALYNSYFMDSYPLEGSIKTFDNYSIVKFSDDDKRLPYHLYNFDLPSNYKTVKNDEVFSCTFDSKYNTINIINLDMNIDNAKDSELLIEIIDVNSFEKIYSENLLLSNLEYTKAGFISIKIPNINIINNNTYKINFYLKSNNNGYVLVGNDINNNILISIY